MIYSAAVDVSSTEPPRRKKRASLTDLRKLTVQNFLLTLCNNGYVRASMIALYFGLCVLYYKKAEHWSITDSVLFVIVTASTVGYGNPHPTNENSRVFTIFLMMFGVFVIFSSMSGLLNGGIVKLNKFLAYRVTSQLKRTELLFQRRLIFSIVWLVLCVFIGAGIFTALEGWSYITALYFVMQTMTTIGYGDLLFQYQATKIFLIFYILLSTTLLGLAINNVYTLLQNRKFLSQRKQLLKLQRKLHFLADMNEGRGVNKFEFVLTILEHIGTLDHDKDIAPWLKKFKELDTYDTGILDQQQLALFSDQHASECEQEIQEMETIVLSISNVEALPSASRTVLNDLRLRSMTIGLFSNEDLYQAENYHHDDDTIMEGLEDSDNEEDADEFSELGGSARSSRSYRSPGMLGRLRSSTARKYSTATNVSGDEDDENSNFSVPGTPIGKMYRSVPLRGGPPSGANRTRNTRDGRDQRGIAGLQSDSTDSPLHNHRQAVSALGEDSPSPPAGGVVSWSNRTQEGSPRRTSDDGLPSVSSTVPTVNSAVTGASWGTGKLASRPISGEYGSTYNALFAATQTQSQPSAGSSATSPTQQSPSTSAPPPVPKYIGDHSTDEAPHRVVDASHPFRTPTISLPGSPRAPAPQQELETASVSAPAGGTATADAGSNSTAPSALVHDQPQLTERDDDRAEHD